MGIIPLFEGKKKSIDKKDISLIADTTTDDLSYQDDPESTVWIFVENETDKINYSLTVPLYLYTNTWIEKFFESFILNVEYREQFKAEIYPHFDDLPEMPKLSKEEKEFKQSLVKEEILNFLKIKNPKFKDFANLKAGRDIFSSLALEALIKEIEDKDFEKIKKEISDESSQAKVIRWMLRGLPLELSIRKIKVEEEITLNFNKSKKK